MDRSVRDTAVNYAEKYPLTFSRDSSRNDPALDERYRRAWAVAEDAAAVLKSEYGAGKVVVFGSLADRSRFSLWSDIDLAAWEVPDDRFYAAVGAVTELSTEFNVDLVDPAECRESLRMAIHNEGIEI